MRKPLHSDSCPLQWCFGKGPVYQPYAIVLKKKAEIIKGVVMGSVLIRVISRIAGMLSVAWFMHSALLIST